MGIIWKDPANELAGSFHYLALLQQSRIEQPQQDEPLFLLRIDDITASVTSAAIAMIDMTVAAFIIQPEQLNNQTMPQPKR